MIIPDKLDDIIERNNLIVKLLKSDLFVSQSMTQIYEDIATLAQMIKDLQEIKETK